MLVVVAHHFVHLDHRLLDFILGRAHEADKVILPGSPYFLSFGEQNLHDPVQFVGGFADGLSLFFRLENLASPKRVAYVTAVGHVTAVGQN